MRDVLARLNTWLDHPAIFPAMMMAGAIFVGSQVLAVQRGEPFAVYDAHVYWLAAGSVDPYAGTIESGFDDSVDLYKFRYPPPLAQVLAPAALLPWPVFAGLWLSMLYVVFLALAGRWALPLLLFYPPVLGELWLGNVNLLIAAAIVVGMRWSAAWAFIILTKITPGIGILWFLVRQEWRAFAIAVGATAAMVAVSFALSPALWSQFREALAVQADAAVDVPVKALPINLPVRLAIAAVIIVIGARMDRSWLLPVAATIASPLIWINVLVILVACVPLLEGRGLRVHRPPRIARTAPGAAPAAAT